MSQGLINELFVVMLVSCFEKYSYILSQDFKISQGKNILFLNKNIMNFHELTTWCFTSWINFTFLLNH